MVEYGDNQPDVVRVYRDEAGEWRWTRRDGGNAEVIGAASEGYVNKGDCYQNIYDTQGGEYVTDDS